MKSAPSSAPNLAAKATASVPRISGGLSKPPGTISPSIGMPSAWAADAVRARFSRVMSSLSEPGSAVTTRASAPTRTASSGPKNEPVDPVLGEPRLEEAPSLRRIRPTPFNSLAKFRAIPYEVRMASAPPATTDEMVDAGCSKPGQGPSIRPWSRAMITVLPSPPKIRASRSLVISGLLSGRRRHR